MSKQSKLNRYFVSHRTGIFLSSNRCVERTHILPMLFFHKQILILETQLSGHPNKEGRNASYSLNMLSYVASGLK